MKLFRRIQILYQKNSIELLLFAFAALLHLNTFFYFSAHADARGLAFPQIGSDSVGYIRLSSNLIEHGVFSRSAAAPFVPDSFRTPGYPFFAAVLLLLFGNISAVFMAQAFLLAGATVIVFRIARIYFSEKISIVAALLFLFDPTGVYLVNSFLSEILFVFFILVASYFCLREDGKNSSIIASAISLGIAALVKPVAIIFIIAFLGFFITQNIMGKKYFSFRHSLLFLLFFTVTIFPWSLRNKIIFQSWQLSHVSVYNLFTFHVPFFQASSTGKDVHEVRELLYKKLAAIRPEAVPGRFTLSDAPYLRIIAWDTINEHPIVFGKFYAIKTMPFFLSGGWADALRSVGFNINDSIDASSLVFRGEIKNTFVAFNDISFVIFFLGSFFWTMVTVGFVAGVFYSASVRHMIPFIVFTVLMVFLLAAAGGPVSNSRIRYPVSPFFFIFAVVGFERIFYRTKRFLTR